MRYPPFRNKLSQAVLLLSLTATQGHAENDPATTDTNKPISLPNRFSSLENQPKTTYPVTTNKSSKAEKALSKTPEANFDNKKTPTRAPHTVDVFELPDIEVVSTTPIGFTGQELKKISGNVQSAEDEEINRHDAVGISDFMNRRLESVNINDTQNNPYQPDVTYRGFTASPLLGTPIGLSVYQDGVRVNEAFGDTVNWDLIPQVAIANMELIPGSNPLFGLNTLGGALSLKTKSGFSHPGFNAQAYGGAYGRQAYQAEIGGSHDKFDWYFAGNIFRDNGWRPFSPTSVNQGFGKVGWEDDNTDLDLSFTYAGNNMQGVGPTPQELLQQNWASIYTAPDVTKNTMYFVNLKGSHRFTDELQLSGNAYNRNNDSSNLNSNFNESCDNWDTFTSCPNSNDPAQPNPTVPGSFAASSAKQNGTGINIQLTSDYMISKHENQLVIGGGYNYGRTHFNQSSQFAIFTPSLYEIGITPFTPQSMLIGENTYTNAFATDTFSVTDWLHINAALNWMQAQVTNSDQINPPSDPAYLGSSTRYQRVNPSAGLTFNPFDALELDTPMKEFTTYFNYNEGFRAPTAIEMGCSNPEVACNLPNSMASDPPTLKAVVSHTMEAGMRGKFSQALKWNFAIYQTINTNDILFENVASTGNISQGYFANVDKTRRQGLEFGLSGVLLESLNWYSSYGFVDATYQSPALLNNAYGAEAVTPGKKIPGIPQNTFKFGAEYEFFRNFFFGGDMQYVSSQYARGDDLNIHQQIPAYTVLNLNTRYVLTKNIELFAMGRNVLGNHYASFGQMGNNFYSGQATQFQGPGAIAAGYAGIRVHWN